MISRRSLTLLLLACSVAFISYRSFQSSAALIEPQQTDPATALSRGRAMLKQGHADQALGYLETALNLYTQTNNSRGIAASEDGLGDLYMIQGQYKVALDHYQKAYQAFVVGRGQDEKSQAAAGTAANLAGNSTASAATQTAASTLDNGFNANLMLAKIGDTNYRPRARRPKQRAGLVGLAVSWAASRRVTSMSRRRPVRRSDYSKPRKNWMNIGSRSST